MSELKLIIVTPCGVIYDDTANAVTVRTVTGYAEILKNHAPFIAPLDIGEVRVQINGESKNGTCTGGTVYADKNTVKIAADMFEWVDSKKPSVK